MTSAIKELDPSKLKQLRMDRGYSQKETAYKLGISPQLLSHYENGVCDPSADMLLTILDFYRVTNYEVVKERI